MTPPRLTWPCPPFNTVNNGFYGPPSVAGQIHHNAVDFPAPNNTRLLQPIVGGGLVTEVGVWGAGGYADTGNMIEVSVGGFSVRMLHLRQSLVRVGQRVAEGEHIGYTDNTGKTTGPHLHMAVWADTKGLALQVQSDPVQVYGRWAVDPEILLALPEEDEALNIIYIAPQSDQNAWYIYDPVTDTKRPSSLGGFHAVTGKSVTTGEQTNGFKAEYTHRILPDAEFGAIKQV